MSAATKPAATTSPDFVISRVFDAPRDLVWRAFTEAEHMKQWWGPKGFTVVKFAIDLRPGGMNHYCLKGPDGSPMWGKFRYREIEPPRRIVGINSFSDEAGGTARHPLHAAWPLEIFTIFTFEDLPGGKTKLTVRWQAHHATAEEQNTFDTNHPSMQMGWTGTFDNLDAYLAKAKA